MKMILKKKRKPPPAATSQIHRLRNRGERTEFFHDSVPGDLSLHESFCFRPYIFPYNMCTNNAKSKGHTAILGIGLEHAFFKKDNISKEMKIGSQRVRKTRYHTSL